VSVSGPSPTPGTPGGDPAPSGASGSGSGPRASAASGVATTPSGGTPTLPEQEARIAELATGFALGELDEAELRELYGALRDARTGAASARVAWQSLDVVGDLRSGLNERFQDALRHRLASAPDDGFAARMWRRLGFAARGLDPVTAPAPSPVARTVALITVVLGAMALAVGATLLALGHHAGAPATVTAVLGETRSGERVLIPGAGLDQRRLAVTPNGQVSLAWPDGASAVLVGPWLPEGSGRADALAHTNGLELAEGRAWVSAGPGFTVLLPDRTCTVTESDTELAIEVIDRHSWIGVARGACDGGGGTAVAARQGIGPAGVYSWTWKWDAVSGTLPGAGAGAGQPPRTWRLSADLGWSAGGDGADFALESTGKHTVTLACIPGQVVVNVDGSEAGRLATTGSPLLATRLDLEQREGRKLTITLAGRTLAVDVPEALVRFQLTASGGAMAKVMAFNPLPTLRPAGK
jgi:hypothetical protein